MKRTLQGLVISDKRDKTVTVLVERTKFHPIYHKRYKVSKKYSVHDDSNEAKKGEMVTFEECRPLSKTKRWQISNNHDQQEGKKK